MACPEQLKKKDGCCVKAWVTDLLRILRRRSCLVELFEEARPVLHEIVYILLVNVAELLGTVAATRSKQQGRKQKITTKCYTLKYAFLITQ